MSDEKEVMEVPAKFQAIVKQIEEMSVLDLSELVHVFEEKFGVSAAAPAMMMAAGAPAGDAAEVAVKSSFNVEITSAGPQKIAVIKAVRELTQMGLKEAKDLVDKAPTVIKENVAKADADAMKATLEAAGATVELK